MGIKGLLPVLKDIQDECNVRKFKGTRVAVDSYSWLHKGVYCCSYELSVGRKTTRHIDYCVRKVQMLLSFGVKPIMVFDGAKLAQKALKEKEREESREANKRKGLCLLGRGKRNEAMKCFQRAVDVTPLMAHELIARLKPLGVKCIVAPYEADAQLAFLSKQGDISTVISEDSDLLVFGCKSVFFKMNALGNGVEIRMENLGDSETLSFANWNKTMLQEMSVLAGCDYLPSINRIGLKKSHSLMSHYRSISKAVEHLRFEGKYDVPDGYEEDCEKAVLTFQYQVVYDDKKKEMTHLNKLPSYLSKMDLSFLGEIVDKDLAVQIAEGEIDPITLEKFDLNVKKKRKEIQKLKRKRVLGDCTNRLTNYFQEETKSIKEPQNIKNLKKKERGKNSKLVTAIESPYFAKENSTIKREIESGKENVVQSVKSPFVAARRLTTRRNFGGFRFRVELFSKEKSNEINEII